MIFFRSTTCATEQSTESFYAIKCLARSHLSASSFLPLYLFLSLILPYLYFLASFRSFSSLSFVFILIFSFLLLVNSSFPSCQEFTFLTLTSLWIVACSYLESCSFHPTTTCLPLSLPSPPVADNTKAQLKRTHLFIEWACFSHYSHLSVYLRV